MTLLPALIAALMMAPSALQAQAAPSGPPSPSSAVSDTLSPPPHSTFSERAPRYRLRGGDSFDVQFEFAPEFDQTVAIQPDGYISLKSVGTIVAQGLTIPELTTVIERAYAGILNDPGVTIDLKDFDTPYFIASGQVGKPGKYELRSDLTLTEGVAIAGGFTEASKHSQVVLFRPGPNGLTEVRVIDVKKMLRSRDLAEDIHLRPGDMIFVPQNRISKISHYLPTSSMGLYGYPQSF